MSRLRGARHPSRITSHSRRNEDGRFVTNMFTRNKPASSVIRSRYASRDGVNLHADLNCMSPPLGIRSRKGGRTVNP